MDPATMAVMYLAVQGGQAIYRGIKGQSQADEAKKEADRAVARLKSIEERDVTSALQVPQLGSELARQELGQQVATQVEALRSSGAAGVLGGLPSLQGASTDAILKISANLQQLEYERNKIQQQQDIDRERRRVDREAGIAQMELQGAQAAAAEGRQQVQSAYAQGAEALFGAARIAMSPPPDGTTTTKGAKVDTSGAKEERDPLFTTENFKQLGKDLGKGLENVAGVVSGAFGSVSGEEGVSTPITPVEPVALNPLVGLTPMGPFDNINNEKMPPQRGFYNPLMY